MHSTWQLLGRHTRTEYRFDAPGCSVGEELDELRPRREGDVRGGEELERRFLAMKKDDLDVLESRRLLAAEHSKQDGERDRKSVV